MSQTDSDTDIDIDTDSDTEIYTDPDEQIEAAVEEDIEGDLQEPFDPLANLAFMDPDEFGTDWQKRPPDDVALHEYEYTYMMTETTDYLRNVEFIRLLGMGAFGKVWEVSAELKTYLKVNDPNLNPYSKPCWNRLTLACKIIRHSDVGEQNILDSLNEMRNLRYLRHENICNFVDIIEIADRIETTFPFSAVVMFFEFCNGTLQQLNSRIRQANAQNNPGVDTLPESLSRHWFAQMARATDYLHSEGVVHQDIHTDNILYCGPAATVVYENDQDYFMYSIFKLGDFGLARDVTPNLTPTIYFWTDDKHNVAKAKDINMLGSVLFDLGVPKAKTRDDKTKFLEYCRTGKWNVFYPQEWLQISPAMKDMLWKLHDNELTAPGILLHEWLQNNDQERTERFIFRSPKVTLPYTFTWES